MYRERVNEVSVISVLDTRKVNKNGNYPVRIQVVHKGTQKYLNTGKDMKKEEWDKLATIRSANLLKKRDDVKATFDLVSNSVHELTEKGEYSFERLCILVGKSSGGTLNSVFNLKMQELKEESRAGTWRFYKTCLRSVEKYAGENIPFENITVQWLNKFESFLLQGNMSYASIGMRMRAIRTMVNIAKKKGFIKESQYPFGKDKYEIKTAVGRKKALSMAKVAQVVAYDDGNETTSFYRDIWFFIYLCNGINVADLVLLKFSDIVDGEICFIRQKTKRTSKVKKEITAPITPQMQAIIDRWGNPPAPNNYIFDLIHHYEDPVRHDLDVADAVKRINKRMKLIGENLGIGKITTYVARHTFATVLKRSGTNISFISESLGHSDLKTTESYLASFEQDERRKNAELLTNFLQPETIA